MADSDITTISIRLRRDEAAALARYVGGLDEGTFSLLAGPAAWHAMLKLQGALAVCGFTPEGC